MTQAALDALLAKIAELRLEILTYELPRNRKECDIMTKKCDQLLTMANAIVPTP
jgi:hypothetical protein